MQTEMSPDRARQQARWLLWQMGSVTVDAQAQRQQTPPQAGYVQTVELPEAALRRGRYESVIRRMQQAGQRTGTYTAWN
ncbi:MAG: hypothetical protein IKK57_12360 [Clostridia bacterium]|nr:hypothetical protein [Clostridia bacterium]